MDWWEVLVIVTALIYFCSSLILFLFPKLVHSKKRSLPSWRHISHRGGSGEELENTMAAFRHAVDSGTDMLELDVHLTKDGEIVVCHDDDLERVAGIDVSITSTNYDNLPRLKKSQELTFHQGHTTTVEHNDNVIPRLREVFEQFPDFPMNIDLKNGSDELIEKVNEMVCEFERESFTVWGSVHNSVCKKMYAMNPRIPLFFSLARVVMVYLILITGLLPFWPLRESCFEFCLPSLMIERIGVRSRVPLIARCLLLCFDTFLLHRLVCFHLQRRGLKVYVFVLNEEEDYDYAMRLGVDGIMTDYPTALKQYYGANRDSDPALRLLSNGQN